TMKLTLEYLRRFRIIFAFVLFLGICHTASAINPPTITTPGTASEPGTTVGNLTPTFQWNGVAGASRYGLAISKSPYGAANIVYSTTTLTGRACTLAAEVLVNGTNYRWNMTSFDSSGTESGNSNTLYFNTPGASVGPPTITSPGTASEPGTTVGNLTPTFQWNGVTGASRYGLAISKSPYGAANVVYSTTTLTGTSFTLPSGFLVNGTNYRWNMTSFNSSGTESGNSNTLYFNTPRAPTPPRAPVGPPTITSPGTASEPGTTVATLTPTFQWSGVTGASRYGLAIS